MSLPAGSIRFPRYRVLLPRTRLAYVHLRNLFTDAKRDRAARVFGYVCVWLPDEFVLFYLQEGEVVNAAASPDGQRFHAIAIADAVAKVPREAEYGEVCFHEADDELLAIMHASQLREPQAWPHDVHQDNPDSVLAHLHVTMFDGVLEIMQDEGRNYVVFRGGDIVRAHFCDDLVAPPESQVRRLIGSTDSWVRVKRWPLPPPLPVQAAPALVQAYRELMANAVRRLVSAGNDSAPQVADQARRHLAQRHPALDRLPVAVESAPVVPSATTTLSFGRAPSSNVKDPIAEPRELSAAVAAWLNELLFHCHPANGQPVERFHEDLLRERRHMFQGAGLFETLHWKLFA